MPGSAPLVAIGWSVSDPSPPTFAAGQRAERATAGRRYGPAGAALDDRDMRGAVGLAVDRFYAAGPRISRREAECEPDASRQVRCTTSPGR